MEIKIQNELIKDDLTDFIELVERLQHSANKTLKEIALQSKKIKMEPSIYIGYVIVKRVIECINSIKILSLLGLERDAAILLLNLIELRLDIMYISLEEKNANEWLNHEKQNVKPWKVGFLFKKLYQDRNELEAERENYKRFSMIKHGNPVGGIHSFPIEISQRKLIFRDKNGTQDRLAVYLFACGNECYNICNTVIGIAENYGFSLCNYKETIDQLHDLLKKLNTAHIYNMLYKLTNNIATPQLCKRCSAIPKGTIEITCLLRQADIESFTENGEFKCDMYS